MDPTSKSGPSTLPVQSLVTFPPLTSAPLSIDEWRARTSSAFVQLEIHPLTPKPFQGRIQTRALDTLSVSLMEHTPAVVARTAKAVAVSAGDLIKASVQVAGEAIVEQDSRVALLQPGDFALYDASRPYTLRFDTDTRMIVFAFSPSALTLPRTELSHVTARSFHAATPMGSVVSVFLAGLSRTVMLLDEDEAETLARTGLDLLMSVVSRELRTELSHDPRSQQLHSIIESIENMLPDPDLTPTMIAEANFISTRHLHSLFSDRSVTVGTWVRTRRLEHIRRDLGDHAFAHLPVAQVASRWGLTNAPHFSRIFRSTFGVSPSEYRARVIDARVIDQPAPPPPST